MADIGVIGLAVMGQNLVLNILDNGHSCAIWNRTHSRTTETVTRHKDSGSKGKLIACTTLEEFVTSLAKPKKVLLMIQAGAAVDAVLDRLCNLLEPGSVLIDGGNEFYRKTELRISKMASLEILFLGMGISGGEEGARRGPSMMPGGSLEGYRIVEAILKSIAAKAQGTCVEFMGKGGAGHYVKMTHNGIEYAIMQIIAEAYDLMRTFWGMNQEKMIDLFERWNCGRLKSYLIEITATVLKKRQGNDYLVDKIVDHAQTKATGGWTVQDATERGIPVPAIAAAVVTRQLSGRINKREVMREKYEKTLSSSHSQSSDVGVEALENAVYAAILCAFDQGFGLLLATSDQEGWNLNLAEIARVWTGGCILRAELLQTIHGVFTKEPRTEDLLAAPPFVHDMSIGIDGLRRIVPGGLLAGVPLPAMSSCLNYIMTLSSRRLPMNLVQGQRDYFGAHTYRRVDKDGIFHTEWTQ